MEGNRDREGNGKGRGRRGQERGREGDYYRGGLLCPNSGGFGR